MEGCLEIPKALEAAAACVLCDHMCVYCLLTHSLPFAFSFFHFLSRSVPAMPQFDPGLSGVVSNRERVGKEV